MSIRRSSGILLPVAALPSPYGIGTLGKAAYDWIDFLAEAGQSWWQVLPLGPTSYGDSPYQSFSTYAGNPYFIDPDLLIEEGILTKKEVTGFFWGELPRYVDYKAVYDGRFELLRKASDRGWKREDLAAEAAAFILENSGWIENYALFMALKRHFGMKSWTEWEDEDIRLHKPEAVAAYRTKLWDEVLFFEFLQYLFFRQWKAVREYACRKGIGIVGDIPIYVALDSADVWSEPGYFRLDEKNLPIEVAGVPPDYFSADGQLWGNPLYDYDRMRADGFNWWIRRVGGAEKMYDVLRIDHFRGFSSYWAVPYGETTAKHGRWCKGPGMDLVGALTGWFHGMEFIAEDLGDLSPDVYELLRASGLPGMKVLEFAFDSLKEGEYQPHSYTENCVCYVGTHDNAPVMEWENEVPEEVIAYAREYFGAETEPLDRMLIRAGLRSVARLFVAQMQDWLGLGAEGRTNTPGTLGFNWQWRLLPGEASTELAAEIRRLTRMYGRTEEEKPAEPPASAEEENASAAG